MVGRIDLLEFCFGFAFADRGFVRVRFRRQREIPLLQLFRFQPWEAGKSQFRKMVRHGLGAKAFAARTGSRCVWVVHLETASLESIQNGTPPLPMVS